MRRDRIIEAINQLREALIDSQIRDIIRTQRMSQASENGSTTQKLLMAYSVFSQHHINFKEEEKHIMTLFGLNHLINVNFWSNLLENSDSVSQKMLSDIEVGIYNVIYVMPKIKDLLVSQNEQSSSLLIKSEDGVERSVQKLQVFVAENQDSLTDTAIISNVIRAMEELYESFCYLHSNAYAALSIGDLDSGGVKSFDFYGTQGVIDDINTTLSDIWHRVKHVSEDAMRYQIELALVAADFTPRITDIQKNGAISEEEGQRIIRLVSRGIETLLQNGAYTQAMDNVQEDRASALLLQRQSTVLEIDSGPKNSLTSELKGAINEMLISSPQTGNNETVSQPKFTDFQVIEPAAE
ncbi:MAG: hypothetical protein AAF228_03020 [Pseudomonadota bacterium]